MADEVASPLGRDSQVEPPATVDRRMVRLVRPNWWYRTTGNLARLAPRVGRRNSEITTRTPSPMVTHRASKWRPQVIDTTTRTLDPCRAPPSGTLNRTWTPTNNSHR